MERRTVLVLLSALSVAGCAQERQVEFVASRKPATELRFMQTRIITGDADEVMRGVIATLHDLGYRITRADAATGTVSATRQAGLRLAVVVQPRPPGQTVVRANATLLGLGQEAQVDSPEFYSRNFFTPLGDTMHRQLAQVAEADQVPEAVRPVAERAPTRGGSPAAPASATQTQGSAR